MAVENIGLELRIVSNLIYNRSNQMTMETEGLTIHQWWILEYLTKNEGKEIYQKDIETLFSIKRASANEMLRTMENRGYIRRMVSKEDARKNTLSVTEEGLNAKRHLQKHLSDFMDKLHGDISKSELEQFQETLHKLWRNIE